MQELKNRLKNELKGSKRVVLLGIGSELRQDDAAGMLTAGALQRFAKESKRLKVVFGSTAPENLTGEIKGLEPTHVIIVDSADIPGKTGSIKLFNPEDTKGISFSTHQLPLSILARYLKEEACCQVLIIGIKPKNIKFGFGLSKEVAASIKVLVKAIKEAVSGR